MKVLKRHRSYSGELKLLFILIFLIPVKHGNGSEAHTESFNDPDSISIYSKMASKSNEKGEYEKTLHYFERMLSLNKQKYSEKHVEIAKTYANIGVIYKKKGSLEKSLKYYNKAIRIFEENQTTDNRSVGTVYSHMGNIFVLKKNYKKGERYYNRAIELLTSNSGKNMDRASMVYNNLGLLYNYMNRHRKAIKYYKKSYSLKKQLGLSTNITLENLGNTYKNMGKSDSAKVYLSHAEEEIRKQYDNKSIHLASIYINQGVLFLQTASLQEAEEKFRKALHIYKNYLGTNHTKIANCFINLGDVYFKKNDYRKSLQYYQEALNALSTNFHSTKLKENPDIDSTISRTLLLTVLKRKAGNLTKLTTDSVKNKQYALSTYNLAMEIIQQLRLGYHNEESKLNLIAEERDTYNHSIQLAINLYELTHDKQYLHQAFNYAERSKAAVLYENIQSNQALRVGNIPDSMQIREEQIKKQIWTYEELLYEEKRKKKPNRNQIEYWNNQLFELQNQYENMIVHFEQKYPKYYQLKYNLEVPDIYDIQRKLNPDEMMLEYVLTSNMLYTFQIEQDHFEVNYRQTDSTLIQTIDSLHSFLSKRDFSTHTLSDFNEFKSLTHQLYATLIGPLDLRNQKRIIVVPDDALSYIPFEILIKENKNFTQISYRDLPYLIKEHMISYSYSAKVLLNQTFKKTKAKKRLAAYAPSYENSIDIPDNMLSTRAKYREKLYPLKGIIEEVNRISKIIPGKIFAKEQATERIFKNTSGKYDILHLAMHTLINDNDPMYSKMAFTQTNKKKEDDFLNTYEIYNLNLSSRLTVLSSCNTGFGKLNKGEGVMSLARGFKYAGCPSIVMTMWPVEDNSSIKLMEYFYEAIKDGKSKDEALREAKLKFMDHSDRLHAHPYFWAGYISIGDQSPLYSSGSIYWIIAGSLLLIAGFVLLFRKRKSLKLF